MLLHFKTRENGSFLGQSCPDAFWFHFTHSWLLLCATWQQQKHTTPSGEQMQYYESGPVKSLYLTPTLILFRASPAHIISVFSHTSNHTSVSTPVSIHVCVPFHSHHVHVLLLEAERTEETGERGENGGCFRAG